MEINRFKRHYDKLKQAGAGMIVFKLDPSENEEVNRLAALPQYGTRSEVARAALKRLLNDHDRVAIDRLAEFLVDDILNMTDSEILDEVAEDGEDIERIARETKEIFESANADIQAKKQPA